MQKIKYFTCFYHTVLFFCPKRCQIKFNKLKNIAINLSADSDSKDFMKIYRECTKEPFDNRYYVTSKGFFKI